MEKLLKCFEDYENTKAVEGVTKSNYLRLLKNVTVEMQEINTRDNVLVQPADMLDVYADVLNIPPNTFLYGEDSILHNRIVYFKGDDIQDTLITPASDSTILVTCGDSSYIMSTNTRVYNTLNKDLKEKANFIGRLHGKNYIDNFKDVDINIIQASIYTILYENKFGIIPNNFNSDTSSEFYKGLVNDTIKSGSLLRVSPDVVEVRNREDLKPLTNLISSPPMHSTAYRKE